MAGKLPGGLKPVGAQAERTKMIGRTLAKRVQKLESRLIPTDEPMVIHIMYVSPDGTVTDGYTIGGPSEDASAPRWTELPFRSWQFFAHGKTKSASVEEPSTSQRL